jgi:hypothetical protein
MAARYFAGVPVPRGFPFGFGLEGYRFSFNFEG